MSRRLVVILGIFALVVISVLVAVLVRTAPPTPDPTPTPTQTGANPATDEQSTMLFAIRNDVGDIAGAVVLGAAPVPADPAGSWLSLQPGLAVDVNTTGTLTLADRGPAAPADTAVNVANQLGFAVDGAMIVDRLAFAALVDAVGGVTVDVASPILATNPAGEPEVLARPGNRKLFGPAAAAYVLALTPDEPQSARMARFDDVFGQIVVRLPGNVDRVRSIVGSLGALSRTSLPPEEIAETLLEVQTALTDRVVAFGVPPASSVGAGPVAVFTLEPAPNQLLVESLFAKSPLVPGRDGALPRVRVLASGVSFDTVVAAQEALAGQDLTMVWGGQAAARPQTRVYIPDESARPLGDEVAALLGVQASAVRVNPTRAAGAQGAVRLSSDSALAATAESPAGTPTTSPSR